AVRVAELDPPPAVLVVAHQVFAAQGVAEQRQGGLDRVDGHRHVVELEVGHVRHGGHASVRPPCASPTASSTQTGASCSCPAPPLAKRTGLARWVAPCRAGCSCAAARSTICVAVPRACWCTRTRGTSASPCTTRAGACCTSLPHARSTASSCRAPARPRAAG